MLYDSDSEKDGLSPKSDTFVLGKTRRHGRSVSTSGRYFDGPQSYDPSRKFSMSSESDIGRREISESTPARDYNQCESAPPPKRSHSARVKTRKMMKQRGDEKESNHDPPELSQMSTKSATYRGRPKRKKKKKSMRKNTDPLGDLGVSSRSIKKKGSDFSDLELQFPYPQGHVTREDLIKLLVRMLNHKDPLSISDRRWHLKSYKKVIIGTEFVDWLVKHQRKTRREAIEIGAKMVAERVFGHVAKRESFDDGYYFYRITASTIEDMPASLQMILSKRKRSLARLFKKQPKNKLRVLLLGLDSAGKTTVMHRLKYNEETNTVATVGYNVETIKHKKVEMNLWDVGGQDRLRPQWRHHYQGTSGVLFVVDSSDQNRIGLAREELHFLMRESELTQAIICVLANKQDMPSALNAHELEEHLELNQLPHDHRIFPTNAKTGEGLEDALDWLSMYMKPF